MLELVDAFLAGLVRLSPLTLCRHRGVLLRALRSWASQGCAGPGDLRADVLVHWKAGRGREVCGRGLHGEVRLVRRFLRWLVREGHLLCDPMPDWFEGRCPPGGVRAVPGEGAMRSLLGRVGTGRRVLPQRDRAVVEVLYGCGLRCMELSGLDLADWRDGELRVRGKGGHERMVPVGRVASEALRAYVDSDRLAVLRRWDPRERALFVGRLGGRLPARAVSAMFRRWQAGMTPHQLRHACATHMLGNGASIVVLKELLGHKGIATTRIYTEVKVEDVRKGLERYHPRG